MTCLGFEPLRQSGQKFTMLVRCVVEIFYSSRKRKYNLEFPCENDTWLLCTYVWRLRFLRSMHCSIVDNEKIQSILKYKVKNTKYFFTVHVHYNHISGILFYKRLRGRAGWVSERERESRRRRGRRKRRGGVLVGEGGGKEDMFLIRDQSKYV